MHVPKILPEYRKFKETAERGDIGRKKNSSLPSSGGSIGVGMDGFASANNFT